MGVRYDDKNTRLCIRISYENQNAMTKHVETAFSPLFTLKKDQHYSLKFEHKTFTCAHLNTKHSFSYKDIQKIVTTKDGVIIYLNNNLYISVATEHTERHNAELYDIVTLLRRRCLRRFFVIDEIAYPEDEADSRYKSDKEALLQISFSLTDTEIKQMIWYDYLFSERMLVFMIAATLFLLMSIIFWNIWLLIVVVAIIALCAFLSKSFVETLNGYIINHQGSLQMLMYDSLLVVRLRHTDVELEYASMKRKRNLLGLWRLKCGDFFILVLPKRIVEENLSFFDVLYTKIK